MMRTNLVLLVALVLSAIYLVGVQYDSRRHFVELDRVNNEARRLAMEHERLQVERRAQATPARVERLAREKLDMRPATAAITTYVNYSAPVGTRPAAARKPPPVSSQALRRRGLATSTRRRGCRSHAMSRSVLYASSPLLASRTPVWRSKMVVAALALAFCGLAARAAYIQVVANDFFQRQGEVRFARTLELPANRGRILDRNGLILASSVPAPSIWAIPEDVDLGPEQRKKLAKLLDMSLADLGKKLADEDKTFVWIKRQVDADVARQIADMNLKGIYQRKDYKRQYPEGEAAAHVVGFTNVEDNGQEGIELLYNKSLVGKPECAV